VVAIKNKGASVIARLKNKSKEKNIPLQQFLNLFCQEEFIRRLSGSKYRNHLILKGGFLLYSLSNFTARPTIDADYLLKDYPNDTKSLEKVINEIITQPAKNDFIDFSVLRSKEINEFKKYTGVRISLVGKIERTQTPFTIDFGVGDIIVPASVKRSLPVLLPDFESPEVITYSFESTVAEKLDAIISLMEATSRMKDFYDIYYLATTFDFKGKDLQDAIYRTFSNRERFFEKDTITAIARLADNPLVQQRWNNFCIKVLKHEIDIDVVIDTIIEFTQLPYDAIVEDTSFLKSWSHKEAKYI